MSYPRTEIEKVNVELYRLAKEYAVKAESLARDPYFRDAVMKVSVSHFVWALYHAFDERGKSILAEELIEQSSAVNRAVNKDEKLN